jgi:hypothetical protein
MSAGYYPNVPSLDPFQDSTAKGRKTPVGSDPHDKTFFPIYLPPPPGGGFKKGASLPSLWPDHKAGPTKFRHRQPSTEQYQTLISTWFEQDNWLAGFLTVYPDFNLSYQGRDGQRLNLSFGALMHSLNEPFRFLPPTPEQLKPLRKFYYAGLFMYFLTKGNCKSIKKSGGPGVYKGLPTHIVQWFKTIESSQIGLDPEVYAPLKFLAQTAEKTSSLCNATWTRLDQAVNQVYDERVFPHITNVYKEVMKEAGKEHVSLGGIGSRSEVHKLATRIQSVIRGENTDLSKIQGGNPGKQNELYKKFTNELNTIAESGWSDEDGTHYDDPARKVHHMSTVMLKATAELRRVRSEEEQDGNISFTLHSESREPTGLKWLEYLQSYYFMMVDQIASSMLGGLIASSSHDPKGANETIKYVSHGIAGGAAVYSSAAALYVIQLAEVFPLVLNFEDAFNIFFRLEYSWGELDVEPKHAVDQGIDLFERTVLKHLPHGSLYDRFVEHAKVNLKGLIQHIQPLASDIQVVKNFLTKNKERVEHLLRALPVQGPWITFKRFVVEDPLTSMFDRDIMATLWQDGIRALFEQTRDPSESFCQAISRFNEKTQAVVKGLRETMNKTKGHEAFLLRPDLEDMGELVKQMVKECVDGQCDDESSPQQNCEPLVEERGTDTCRDPLACRKTVAGGTLCCTAEMVRSIRFRTLYDGELGWFVTTLLDSLNGKAPVLVGDDVEAKIAFISQNWTPSGSTGVSPEVTERISSIGIPPAVTSVAEKRSGMTVRELKASIFGQGEVRHHKFFEVYKEGVATPGTGSGLSLFNKLPNDVWWYMNIQMMTDTNHYLCVHHGAPSGSSKMCSDSLVARLNAVEVPDPGRDPLAAKIYLFERLLPNAIYRATAHRVYMMCQDDVARRLRAPLMREWIKRAWLPVGALLAMGGGHHINHPYDSSVLCPLWAVFEPKHVAAHRGGPISGGALGNYRDHSLALEDAMNRSVIDKRIIDAWKGTMADIVTIVDGLKPVVPERNTWNSFYADHYQDIKKVLPLEFAMDRLMYMAQETPMPDMTKVTGPERDANVESVQQVFSSAVWAQAVHQMKEACTVVKDRKKDIIPSLLNIRELDVEKYANTGIRFVYETIRETSIDQALANPLLIGGFVQSLPATLGALALTSLNVSRQLLCHFVLGLGHVFSAHYRSKLRGGSKATQDDGFLGHMYNVYMTGALSPDLTGQEKYQRFVSALEDNDQLCLRVNGILKVLYFAFSKDPTRFQLPAGAWSYLVDSAIEVAKAMEWMVTIQHVGTETEVTSSVPEERTLASSMQSASPALLNLDEPWYRDELKDPLLKKLRQSPYDGIRPLGVAVGETFWKVLFQWVKGKCSFPLDSDAFVKKVKALLILAHYTVQRPSVCMLTDTLQKITANLPPGQDPFSSAKGALGKFKGTPLSFITLRQQMERLLTSMESWFTQVCGVSLGEPRAAAFNVQNIKNLKEYFDGGAVPVDRAPPDTQPSGGRDKGFMNLLLTKGGDAGKLLIRIFGEGVYVFPEDDWLQTWRAKQHLLYRNVILPKLQTFCYSYFAQGKRIKPNLWAKKCDVPFLLALILTWTSINQNGAHGDEQRRLEMIISEYLTEIIEQKEEEPGPYPSLGGQFLPPIAARILEMLELGLGRHDLLIHYLGNRWVYVGERWNRIGGISIHHHVENIHVLQRFTYTLFALMKNLQIASPYLQLSFDAVRWSEYTESAFLQLWTNPHGVNQLWSAQPALADNPYPAYWVAIGRSWSGATISPQQLLLVRPKLFSPLVSMAVSLRMKRFPWTFEVWNAMMDMHVYSLDGLLERLCYLLYPGTLDAFYSEPVAGGSRLSRLIQGILPIDDLNRAGHHSSFPSSREQWEANPVDAAKMDLLTSVWPSRNALAPDFEPPFRILAFSVLYGYLVNMLKTLVVKNHGKDGWKFIEEWRVRRALATHLNSQHRTLSHPFQGEIENFLKRNDCIAQEVMENPNFRDDYIWVLRLFTFDELLCFFGGRICKIETGDTVSESETLHNVLRVPWREDYTDGGNFSSDKWDRVPNTCMQKLLGPQRVTETSGQQKCTEESPPLKHDNRDSYDFIFDRSMWSSHWEHATEFLPEFARDAQDKMTHWCSCVTEGANFSHFPGGESGFENHWPFSGRYFQNHETGDEGWHNLEKIRNEDDYYNVISRVNTIRERTTPAYTLAYHVIRGVRPSAEVTMTQLLTRMRQGQEQPSRGPTPLPLVTVPRRSTGEVRVVLCFKSVEIFEKRLISTTTLESVFDQGKRRANLVGPFEHKVRTGDATYVAASPNQSVGNAPRYRGHVSLIIADPPDSCLKFNVLELGSKRRKLKDVSVLVHRGIHLVDFAEAIKKGQLGIFPSELRYVCEFRVTVTCEHGEVRQPNNPFITTTVEDRGKGEVTYKTCILLEPSLANRYQPRLLHELIVPRNLSRAQLDEAKYEIKQFAGYYEASFFASEAKTGVPPDSEDADVMLKMGDKQIMFHNTFQPFALVQKLRKDYPPRRIFEGGRCTQVKAKMGDKGLSLVDSWARPWKFIPPITPRNNITVEKGSTPFQIVVLLKSPDREGDPVPVTLSLDQPVPVLFIAQRLLDGDPVDKPVSPEHLKKYVLQAKLYRKSLPGLRHTFTKLLPLVVDKDNRPNLLTRDFFNDSLYEMDVRGDFINSGALANCAVFELVKPEQDEEGYYSRVFTSQEQAGERSRILYQTTHPGPMPTPFPATGAGVSAAGPPTPTPTPTPAPAPAPAPGPLPATTSATTVPSGEHSQGIAVVTGGPATEIGNRE